MPKFTIDVNVVLAWMELQSPELCRPAGRFFQKMRRGEEILFAPEFLLVELTNVLKWRYKRDERESGELIKRTRDSGIRFVAIGSGKVEEINKLVHKYGLTSYDALYLFVAQKMECKLVTTDPKLLEVKEWCEGLGK